MAKKQTIKRYSLADKEHPLRYFNMDSMEDIYDRTNGSTSDPHRHDFYTIVWVKQGQGRHMIDFNDYEITDNQVYFLSPGRVHQINLYTRPVGCVISFSRDFLEANNISEDFLVDIHLFRQYDTAPPLTPDFAKSDKLQRLVEDMDELYNGDSHYKYVALGALLKLFLVYSNQICDLPREGAGDKTDTRLVRNFKKAVEENYRAMHKVASYAEKLFITPKYLNEVFKGLTGYAPKEYIQDRIIMEAKRQLLFSNQTVKEIAFELGFKEQFHFSAFFKKCTGLSPTAFRAASIG